MTTAEEHLQEAERLLEGPFTDRTTKAIAHALVALARLKQYELSNAYRFPGGGAR